MRGSFAFASLAALALVLLTFVGLSLADSKKEGGALFTLSASSVAPGATVEVKFARALESTDASKYWITIIDASQADSEWGAWQYVDDGAKGIALVAPQQAGTYEVRLHADYPSKGYNVVQRATLTVGGGMFETAGAEFGAGKAIKVKFAGKMKSDASSQFWITVIAPTLADSEWGEWAYVPDGATEMELPAPATPGTYEIRLHADYPNQSYNVVHRVAVTVE